MSEISATSAPRPDAGTESSTVELTRREAIRQAALALTALGTGALAPAPLQPRAAAMVHHQTAAAAAAGGYGPRCFNAREWRLLRRLAELIVPADEHSGSALDAGAPEFVDLLCSNNPELARIFTSGMLWLDHETERRHGAAFADAPAAAQAAMIDLLAGALEEPEVGYQSYEPSPEYQGFLEYTVTAPSELLPGARFFGWARRLVVDAFYTSPEGVKDLDYQGNQYRSEYSVPDEVIDYALARSPFGR